MSPIAHIEKDCWLLLPMFRTKLRCSINKLARIEGKTSSRMVRELIEDYIKERDIGSYIDDLWNRVGGKLRSRGVKPGDIDKAIKEVRRKRG